MIRTLRYLLNLRGAQRCDLEAILESQRWLYNEALAWRMFAWETYGVGVSHIDQCRWLTYMRGKDERLRSMSVRMQQDTLKRLDNAYISYFRRCSAGEAPGHPRFKAKDRFHSFAFRSFANGIHFDGKRLWFKGVRGKIRLDVHRPLPKYEKLLGCTFKKVGARWFVFLQVRIPTPDNVQIKTSVGVDVGLTSLATLSTGESIRNIRVTSNSAAELRVAQRALNRCVSGSRRREKIKAVVSRCHERSRNARDTHLHRVSKQIVNRFDLIAVEDLNITGMCHGVLAKHVHDAGWGKLIWNVAYKAEDAGKQCVRVEPRGTSQECSGCGSRVPKTLRDRVHSCPSCGLVLDRDHNAALNILHRAGSGPERPNVAHRSERAAGVLTALG